MSSKRMACPSCRSRGEDSQGNHLRPYEDGKGGWCFKENKTIWFNEQDRRETPITYASEVDVASITSNYHILAVPSRQISKETCERYGVKTEVSSVDGSQESILYPYYANDMIVGYKRRRLSPKSFSVVGKIKGLFGQAQCKQNARFLIIVEGEQDVLAGWEMLHQRGKNYNIVSLPNGANEEGTIDATTMREIEWIVKHEKVLLMLDNDQPGRETAKALAETLASQTTVGITTFPSGLKDTSDYWENDLVDDWYKAMSNAVVYRPESIVEGKDISLADLKKPKEPGVKLPYPRLQKMTWGVRKGEITLLTAGTGIGKTTFANEIGFDLVDQGYTVAKIALETQMEDVARTLIAMDNNVPAYQLMFNPNLISDEAYQESYDKIMGSNRTHFFKHWGSMDPDVLKTKMLYFAKTLGVDFIILDHVSMVIAGNETSDERKDIDKLFANMTNIVTETGVGILPIIHLKRVQGKNFNRGDEVDLSDLRGSAGAEQMSFNVWALERDMQGENNKDRVRLRVLKNRTLGFTGVADTLIYDHLTGRLKLFDVEV